MTRAESWPGGLRWIARRVKPSRGHKKNLTAHERKTGCTIEANRPPCPVRARAAPGPDH